MAFSVYLGNTVIDHLLRNQAFTTASSIWVSLHSGDPGTDWPGANEVSGSSYARKQLTLGAASAKASSNSGSLAYPGMPATNVTHAAIFNWSTAGSLLMSGSLSASKVVNSGDEFQFAVSAITVNIT